MKCTVDFGTSDVTLYHRDPNMVYTQKPTQKRKRPSACSDLSKPVVRSQLLIECFIPANEISEISSIHARRSYWGGHPPTLNLRAGANSMCFSHGTLLVPPSLPSSSTTPPTFLSDPPIRLPPHTTTPHHSLPLVHAAFLRVPGRLIAQIPT